MPDPVLTLGSARVVVAPGGQVSVPVTVTSTSSIVEGFRLDVVGSVAAQWADMVPPVVDVYPGEEASAVVVFSPPADSKVSSGVFPFGIRARSTESTDDSAVVEGDVEVGQIAGLQSKLVPITSKGRWRGRHTVQVSNSGNAPATLHLVASDPDEALGFYLHPDVVELAAGQSTTVRMTVRTRHPFLRGTQLRLPFQVVGEPADAPPGAKVNPYDDPSRPVVDGALLQKPILTKPLVAVVGALLVAALGGGIWAWMNPQAPAGALESLGPPDKPAGVVAAAVGDHRVRLGWAPISQVTAYKVLGIDPSDRTSVNQTHEVDSSQNVLVLADLAPASHYCYAVVAQRGSLTSPQSDVACATTAAKIAAPTKPGEGKTTKPKTKAEIVADKKKAAADKKSAAEKKKNADNNGAPGTSDPGSTPAAPTTITATVTPPPATSTATATATATETATSTATETATVTVAPPVMDTYIVAWQFKPPPTSPSEGVGVQDVTSSHVKQLMDALANPDVGMGNKRIQMDPPVFPQMTIAGDPVPTDTIAIVAVGPYAETDNAGIVAGCLSLQKVELTFYNNDETSQDFSTQCELALLRN